MSQTYVRVNRNRQPFGPVQTRPKRPLGNFKKIEVVETCCSVSFSYTVDTADGGSLATTINTGGGFTLNINWGDGQKSVLPQGSSSITHTYAGAGVYNVQVSSNSGGAGYGGVFTQLIINNASDTDGLSALSALASLTITGGLNSTPGLPASIRTLNLDGNDIAVFEGLPSAIMQLSARNNPITAITVPSGVILLNLDSSLSTAALVNNVLTQLNGSGKLNGAVSLKGSNPAPTGMAATITSLEGKGWVVSVNV